MRRAICEYPRQEIEYLTQSKNDDYVIIRWADPFPVFAFYLWRRLYLEKTHSHESKYSSNAEEEGNFEVTFRNNWHNSPKVEKYIWVIKQLKELHGVTWFLAFTFEKSRLVLEQIFHILLLIFYESASIWSNSRRNKSFLEWHALTPQNKLDTTENAQPPYLGLGKLLIHWGKTIFLKWKFHRSEVAKENLCAMSC